MGVVGIRSVGILLRYMANESVKIKIVPFAFLVFAIIQYNI